MHSLALVALACIVGSASAAPGPRPTLAPRCLDSECKALRRARRLAKRQQGGGPSSTTPTCAAGPTVTLTQFSVIATTLPPTTVTSSTCTGTNLQSRPGAVLEAGTPTFFFNQKTSLVTADTTEVGTAGQVTQQTAIATAFVTSTFQSLSVTTSTVSNDPVATEFCPSTYFAVEPTATTILRPAGTEIVVSASTVTQTVTSCTA